MSNYNLSSVGLICEFNASVWTARKMDRKESDKVVEGAGAANKGAARVNKNLLAGRPELEEIAQLVTRTRNYVTDNTLPWSDTGQRFLVGLRFPEFDKRIDAFRAEFDQKAGAFITLYPTLITAQAMALGAMFNRSEFPAVAEIANKFAMSMNYLPVPASGDIRVDIGNQAQDELRERLQKMADARVEKAMGDMTERFVGHLKRMARGLEMSDKVSKKGEPVGNRFTETLVTSAFELCDLVRDYNLTADPELAHARRLLENALSGVTVQTLRDDLGKREDVRVAVTSILGKFSI